MELKELAQTDGDLMSRLFLKCIEEGAVLIEPLQGMLQDCQGYLLYDKGQLAGFAAYRQANGELRILMIKSFEENRGYGSLLLRTLLNRGIDEGVNRVSVEVTNDNLRGLRFLQRMGFTLCKIHLNAVGKLRRQSPDIPLYNDFIKVEHTLELEQQFIEEV